MNIDENQSSQQQEGFYKPQLKVIDSNQSSPPLGPKLQQFTDEANDLIMYNRPTDFLPRVLSTSPAIYEQLIDLDLVINKERQILNPIQRQKIKRIKYNSLKDKYKSNQLYKLIYSKIESNNQFNSYIYSLNQTTDFNPNNYQQIMNNNNQNINKFQSRFESGNLLYAYKYLQSKIQQYDLILQNDTNTKGYNQWFYFSFRNQTSKIVKFNIVNLIKKHSLFQQGIKPIGFSLQRSQKGWYSIGNNIQYQKSYINRQVSSNPPIYKNYYTLSFKVNFQIQNDVVYIALNYPYTYSRMIKFINQIPDLYPRILYEKNIVAYSISNNAIPLIRLKHREYKDKKKILIMGRQHPGETVGSFVLEGFIHHLLSQQILLKYYQIIVIPMVNPDGVIYGNFRTNLAGFDLNRQWIDPNRWMHPQTYYISKYIQSLDNISFVIDFHGHSKKYNSFIFACTGENIHQYRLFPYICSQQTNLFSLKDCTYSITYDKQKTARIKLYRLIKKPQIFTLQTSFFGYMDQTNKKYRYQINDLLEIGKKIGQSLQIYLINKKQYILYQKEIKQKDYLFDQWNLQNKQDIDSQSNPSQDQLTPIQRKQKVLCQKSNKKIKSKKKKKKKQKDNYKEQKKVSINLIQNKPKIIIQEKKQNGLQRPNKIFIPDKFPQNINKRKTQSLRLVHFTDFKVNKKIHKALTIINPPIPKQATVKHISTKAIVNPNNITPVNFQSPHKQKFKQIQIPEIKSPILEQKKFYQQPAPIVQPSNLFNTTNFYAQLHEKLKRQQKTASLYQKTQSLQINNIKRQMIFPKGNTINVLRKLIATDDETDYKQLPSQSGILKLKPKQKGFMIRQNRTINSISKVQQDELKKNLEQQINNRTQALRNCQKKMRQMSLDEPILHNNEDMNGLTTTNLPFFINSTPKTYKFPTIRMDKKLDYFNF